jgi:hypothetical protein
MPIIIYGTRGQTADVSSGEFDCPHCRNHTSYRLREVTRYFTLFFLPIFPTGSGQRFVECDHCGSQFKEAVLDYCPATPKEDELFLLAAVRQLRDGLSIEELRDKFIEAGENGEQMESLLVKMCEDNPWRCDCGLRFHPGVTRCHRCGKEAVLGYCPTSPEEHALLLAAAKQLRDGLSIEEVRAKLSEAGEDREQMESLLIKLCEGKSWRCDCGLRFHPDVTRCHSCGKEL